MISSLLLRISVVLLLVGLVAGIAMGVTQNFTYVPAHAHLNLVGGVLMFMAGLYYRLVPEAGASALAKVHATLHIVAAIVFPIGIAAVLTNPRYEPVAIAGAFIVLAAIATFAVIVFRTSTARA